jgi:large subunit ribosomal protein L13
MINYVVNKELKMKTYLIKDEEIKPKWYIVNVEGKVLGRAATKIAEIVRGKKNIHFSRHQDLGDFVIVINADKIELTGNKWNNKLYYRHSSYPGGLKVNSAKKINDTKPDFLIYHAVKGMLPKNTLGSKLIKKLKIYKGSNHPHQAQKPEPLII